MSVKYIGLDVHQATTVAAVLDAHGKLVMECIVRDESVHLARLCSRSPRRIACHPGSTMDIDKANAAPRCQHISDCGRPCGSPALRDHAFCYNHFRIHQTPPNPRLQPELFIPQLETRESIELAVTNVSRAVCTGDLTPQQANSIIRAIRLLQWVIKQLTQAMSDVLHRSGLCSADTPVRASASSSPDTDGELTTAGDRSSTDIPVVELPASPSGEAKPLRALRSTGGLVGEKNSPSPVGPTPGWVPSPLLNLPARPSSPKNNSTTAASSSATASNTPSTTTPLAVSDSK
jgi:hypothetical protein